MNDVVLFPTKDAEDYVELARTKSGRLFRKHVLSTGKLIHPGTGEQVDVNDDFLSTVKANFDAGVCDIVQIPLANDANQHSEDPDRNIGEVIGVEVKDGKLYNILDVRDETRADKVGKTYLGASAMLHLDYTDTKTGGKVGPTLLHHCVTNRPWVTGLEEYEEIKDVVKATSDRGEGAVLLRFANDEPSQPPAQRPAPEETVMTDEPTTPPATPAKATLDELLAALKNDHGIDVPGLQAQAAQGAATASLSKTLTDALSAAGVLQLSNTDKDSGPSSEDIAGAVVELNDRNVKLSNDIQTLQRRDAERDVDALIGEGRIFPAERDARVELKLTNSAMFDKLLPTQPILKLDAEKGVTPPDTDKQKHIDDEIARLTNAYLEPSAKK